MSMSNLALCLILLTGSLSACHVHDNDWNEDGPVPDLDGGAVCSSFCGHLVTCGDIGSKQVAACTDTCEAALAGRNGNSALDGCKCVMKAACGDSSYCSGAPVPGIATASSKPGAASSSSSADAGSSSDATPSATPSGVYTCKSNAQCAWSEDCISGACLVRCNASCECHAKESCSAGHCSLPVAPASSCKTDCDCPSGKKCMVNVCK